MAVLAVLAVWAVVASSLSPKAWELQDLGTAGILPDPAGVPRCLHFPDDSTRAPLDPARRHFTPREATGSLVGPCFGLAGLPVVLSFGLVWPAPALPALPWLTPATTTASAKPPQAAEGHQFLLLLDHVKARHARLARQARQAQARRLKLLLPSLVEAIALHWKMSTNPLGGNYPTLGEPPF